MLLTDPRSYMLIIENILFNAWKLTKPDGCLDVTVKVNVEMIFSSIADNGVGIPEKLKPYIFDKFSKARRTGHQGKKQ